MVRPVDESRLHPQRRKSEGLVGVRGTAVGNIWGQCGAGVRGCASAIWRRSFKLEPRISTGKVDHWYFVLLAKRVREAMNEIINALQNAILLKKKASKTLRLAAVRGVSRAAASAHIQIMKPNEA